MLPVWQLTVGAAVGVAAAGVVAATEAAAAGVSVGATVGVGVADAEHAPAIIAAATAMAPKRRIPLNNLVSPLCWTDG
jgi:predicted acylesterase/phospholipase RssA